jgi:RNA polymerase sigma factor (sigma-70 family)
LRIPVPFSQVKTHEEVFVEYYAWLVRWALRLSEGLHEDATDLVHDLYLQLIRTRPNLDTANEDRVRAYLYTMLRNLAISKARRSGHDPLSALSIVDYDSVEYGLASVDRSQLIFVRSDLGRICEYAARRKHTSRAASVLILRFFLSYYPSEILRILKTTRVAVENHLRSARIEVRAYLRQPQSLRFLGHDITPATTTVSLPDDPELLFLALRRRLLETNPGECSRDEVIEARYSSGCALMDVAELAHVVGCWRCLEKTNRVLGLPGLATRFPADAIDRDSGGNEPPASGNGGSDDCILKRKIQHTHEHKPRKLQIAVDGEIRAAQRVSMAHNELQVKLNPLQKPSFLEVFSDQGVRLLYLQLENTIQQDLSPHYATAELSDGRSIELEFSLAHGAAVACALYSDPQIPDLLEEDADLRAETMASRDTIPSSSDRNLVYRLSQSLIRCIRLILKHRDFLVPLGIAVSLASLFICALQVVSKKTSLATSPVTAERLFAQAKAVENSSIPPGGAVHSTFSLTTLSETGAILDTQRVERWDSLEPRRSALRLIDEKGAIIAGRWRNRRGKVTNYLKGHGLRQTGEAKQSEASFQNAWELIPGIDILPTWKELESVAGTRRVGNDYEVLYERPESRTGSGVVRASLVLDASTVRAVREDVVLKQSGATREYRFEQLSYKVVPASQVQDSDFLPPEELASPRSGINGNLDESEHRAQLLLSALEIADTFGPEVSDALDIERLPDGKVQLSGVIPTNEQRDAIRRAILLLPATGQLLLAIHSSEDLRESSIQQRPVLVESTAPIAVEEERIPFDPAIRATLISQGVGGEELETRIRKIASDAVNDVSKVHRSGWLLRQIADLDFSPYDLKQLRREDQIRWIALLRTHARLLHQNLELLSHDLTFLSTPSSPSAARILPLENTTELAQAAEGLNNDCERLNRLLTAGLTLTPSVPPPETSVSDTTELLKTIVDREKILSATVEHISSVR